MGTESKPTPVQNMPLPQGLDQAGTPEIETDELVDDGPQPPTPACLVIINTSHHNLLGWTYRIEKPLITVGRSPTNDIVIDDQSVSRKHCTLELSRERFIVHDLGSSNGTRYNGEKFRDGERVLCNLDRIRIGHSEFIFLQGADIEQRRKQALDSFSALDGVSGAFNQRAFEVLVSRVLEVANSEKKPVCLMLVQVDGLQKIHQNLGQSAADALLSALTAKIRHRLRHRDLIGRMGASNVLAVVVTKYSLARCLELAESIRDENRRSPCLHEGQPLVSTLTLGIAPYVFGTDLKTWTKMADDHLYMAIRAGGDCVRPEFSQMDDEPGLVDIRAVRRVQDAEQVVRKALTTELAGPIIAFEIEDEPMLLHCLGAGGREQWIRELEDDLLGGTQFDEEVGTWLNRYVIAVLSRTRVTPADEVILQVTESWCGRSVPSEMLPMLQRRLRVATLEPADLLRHKERSLHELAARLLGRSDPVAERSEGSRLPFPLAAPRLVADTRKSGPARIKSLVDAIGSALQFVVALEVSLLRTEEKLLPRLAEALHAHMDRALPVGAWLNLAWQCAALTPAKPGGLFEVFGAFVDRDARPSVLTTRLQEALAQASPLATGQAGGDGAGQHERRLGELQELLTRALLPLSECTLVRLEEMINFDEEKEEGLFDLHILNGPSARFPVEQRTLPAIIGYKDWCYLLCPSLPKPLILAPMVAAKVCPLCQRHEVFLADRIGAGPPGAKVSLRAVTSVHEIQLDVPKIKPIRALYDLLEPIRQSLKTNST